MNSTTAPEAHKGETARKPDFDRFFGELGSSPEGLTAAEAGKRHRHFLGRVRRSFHHQATEAAS